MTAAYDEPETGLEPSVPMEPIPVAGEVRVTHHVVVRTEAADYGSYSMITVPANQAFSAEILPYDENRKYAAVAVQTGGPVSIGSQAQCQAASPLGALINTNDGYVPITHKQAVWLAGDGTHTATVGLIIERWE